MDQHKRLWPTEIYGFDEIRASNYHYVDKTGDAWRLANSGKRLVFLGRPRRFGKSLLMSTLEAYFQGQRELFDGTEAEGLEAQKGNKAWQVSPVLRFDMSQADETVDDLRDEIARRLRNYEHLYQIENREAEPRLASRLITLIETLAGRGTPPVILIDEYDHPLAHSLEGDTYEQFLMLLRGFYTVLKGSVSQLRFAMLTGVSQFRHVNVFSGLNNVTDITLDPDYATICGISEEELMSYFEWRVQELAQRQGRNLQETYDLLKANYDGYRFTEREVWLYNPYNIICCLESLKVRAYWDLTGTPYVLRILLPDTWYNFTEPEEGVTAAGGDLLSFDPESGDPIPILFQAGYLTIKGYDEPTDTYQLTFPNIVVRDAFYDDNKELILGKTGRLAINTAKKMAHQINSGDVPGMMESLRILLDKVPYTVKMDDKPVPEALFQVALFFVMRLTGKEAHMEVMSLQGRSDIEIRPKNYIYIFEIKKNKTPQAALDQIVARKYGNQYEDSGKRIIEIGINFNTKTYEFEWLAQYHKGALIEPTEDD